MKAIDLREWGEYRRRQLPQVNRHHLEELGIPYQAEMVARSRLEPSQHDRDLKPKKIRKAQKSIQSGDVKPLVVDQDYRIINGHHRYAAASKLGLDTMMVYRALDSVESIARKARGVAPIHESSPDTMAGSFTPDLEYSKVWLCDVLKSVLQDQPPMDIYVLGSWYGHLGVVLQEQGVPFQNLHLVEIDQEKLESSARLLPRLKDQGRLNLIHSPAENVQYQTPCIVINTSANEMSRTWLDMLPFDTLVAIQGRNGISDQETPTETLWDFDATFILSEVYYCDRRRCKDPETAYTRFMKVGRK